MEREADSPGTWLAVHAATDQPGDRCLPVLQSARLITVAREGYRLASVAS
jgi:hypothetical protein